MLDTVNIDDEGLTFLTVIEILEDEAVIQTYLEVHSGYENEPVSYSHQSIFVTTEGLILLAGGVSCAENDQTLFKKHLEYVQTDEQHETLACEMGSHQLILRINPLLEMRGPKLYIYGGQSHKSSFLD